MAITGGYSEEDLAAGATQDRNWVDFSCFLISREVYEALGPFDEAFQPAYFEDADYYRRLILAGYQTAASTDAVFSHGGSTTMRKERSWIRAVNPVALGRNRQYYELKWAAPGTTRRTRGRSAPSLLRRRAAAASSASAFDSAPTCELTLAS